jgi:hypothetical protein
LLSSSRAESPKAQPNKVPVVSMATMLRPTAFEVGVS